MKFNLELLHDSPIDRAHDRLADVDRSIAVLSIYGEHHMTLTTRELLELRDQTDAALGRIFAYEAKVPKIDRWGAIKIEEGTELDL